MPVLVVVAGCSSSAPKSSAELQPVTIPQIPRLVLNTAIVDSQVFSTRNLGVLYRYGSGDVQKDVYVYPKGDWPDVVGQAKAFIQTLEIEKRRGRFDPYEVMLNAPFNMETADTVRAAHEVIARLIRKGEPRNSYFAVVSTSAGFVKFRITHRPDAVDVPPRDFVSAWIAAYFGQK